MKFGPPPPLRHQLLVPVNFGSSGFFCVRYWRRGNEKRLNGAAFQMGINRSLSVLELHSFGKTYRENSAGEIPNGAPGR